MPKIAYMPQGLGKNLYTALTVSENVDFFGRLFGQDRAEREVPNREAARRHRPCAICQPLHGQTVRWHEAEAWLVLCPGPRS